MTGLSSGWIRDNGRGKVRGCSEFSPLSASLAVSFFSLVCLYNDTHMAQFPSDWCCNHLDFYATL